MKRAVQTGRRTLAVLMAVLMLLLAFPAAVFAAETVTVTFVNEFATDTVDANNGLTTAVKTETIATVDVESGATVAAPADTPVRAKDADYGAYTFKAWATKDAEGNYADFDFSTAIDEDTTLYATFTGKEVYYEVDFRSDGVYVAADGTLQPNGTTTTDEEGNTVEAPKPRQKVLHGQAATPPSANPTRAPQEHYTFEFARWDYDYTHIYESRSIEAVYNAIGKPYVLVYCDYDGSELGRENIRYGEKANDVPSVPNERFSTAESNFVFLNEWSVQQDGLANGGEMINMNAVTFNSITVKDGGKVKVYAQYRQQLREYFFHLEVVDEDGDPAEGVYVDVTGSDGQLLTTFTDEALGHNGGRGVTDENGQVTLSVPWQSTYTLTAVDTYYNKAVQREFTVDWIANDAHVSIQLGDSSRYNDQYNNTQPKRCNDICHTFLGNFWISGLNIFYRLFKVKYVCCYDMYATHGDKLVYASYSSGKTIDRS